jgi:hypothetical protein
MLHITESHQYFKEGVQYISVTTLRDSWFKKFNADETLKKMRTKPMGRYEGMTDEEIKQLWASKGELAATQGTALHKHIELYYKLTPVVDNSIEYAQFLTFVQDSSLVPYEIEWMVCDQETRVAGTIDFVAENKDGTIDLYDWKRSSKVNEYVSSYSHCLEPELSHIPDTTYWKYTMQLNLYRYIVEKMGKRVRRMFLVCFHPDILSYQKYQVAEVDLEKVLNRRKG